MTKRETILGRIEAGRTYLLGLAGKAERYATRYREMGGRLLYVGEDDGGAASQPLGQINYPAINVRQKVASTAYSAPDFAVKCVDRDAAEAVRRALVTTWRQHSVLRTVRQALMSRILSGIGFVAYLWEADRGFVVEHVKAADLFVDPHIQDSTWNSMRWGGRRISLPTWVAEQRYPGIGARTGAESRPSSDRRDSICVDVYWDADTEAEVCGQDVLAVRENPYGRVPIVAMLGDINPESSRNSEFPLGDYDQVIGASEMLRRLQDIMNTAGQHGGGYAWVDGAALDPASREAILRGDHTKVVVLNGLTGDKAMGYTPVMPVNPALLSGMQYIGAGIDADMGVTQYQRGVVSNSPKFATEAMLTQSSSGVRGQVARVEYEEFCSTLAQVQVLLTVAYGDPGIIGPDVWQAFASVEEVRVVEDSASWRDPAMEEQAAMQLFQSVIQAMPTYIQLAQQGLIREIPNAVRFLNDVLLARRGRERESYWLTVEPVQTAQPDTPTQDGTEPTPGVGPEEAVVG